MTDAISWEITTPFPQQVSVGGTYSATYRFQSNLPQEMTAPLTVVKIADADFTFDDNATGKQLKPDETAEVVITLTPTVAEHKTLQLELHYYNDEVPLPAVKLQVTA